LRPFGNILPSKNAQVHCGAVGLSFFRKPHVDPQKYKSLCQDKYYSKSISRIRGRPVERHRARRASALRQQGGIEDRLLDRERRAFHHGVFHAYQREMIIYCKLCLLTANSAPQTTAETISKANPKNWQGPGNFSASIVCSVSS